MKQIQSAEELKNAIKLYAKYEDEILYIMLHQGIFFKELKRDYFTKYESIKVFESIELLDKQKKEINFDIAIQTFKDNKKISDYLIRIYSDTILTQPNTYYIDAIKKELDRRELNSILQEAQSNIEDQEPKEVIQKLEKDISLISEKQKLRDIREIDKPYTMEELRKDWLKNSDGYKTGYTELDRHVSFKPGTVNFVAARPGCGKTTFMLNILCKMVKLYEDKKFYFISYEESLKKIVMKTITILSNYTYLDTINIVKRDNNFHSEYENYNNSSRLRIIYESFEINNLSYFIESLHTKHKDSLGVIFIDYIQEIRTNSKYQSRQIELHYICQVLLDVANKTNVAIVLGSQLNRETTGRPKAENMREADDILNIANVILGLWTEDESPLKITILKNREGEKDKEFTLTWEKERFSIREMSETKYGWGK